MSKKINTLAVGAKVRDPLSKYYGVPVGFQIADKNHARPQRHFAGNGAVSTIF